MREGWEIRKLGDICEIKNGRTQKAVENPNGPYPIYGSGGIMGYANDYICEAGTTIIGRKGTINKPLFVERAFWNVDTAFGLQPKSTTNPRFLYYTCKSIDFLRYNKSTTLPSLVKSDLLQINVQVPSVQEQEKIVVELDSLSEVIAWKKQQLEELDKLAQSIFYDMFGDPIVNEKGWPVKKLGDICHHITDGDHMPPPKAEKGVPFITISNIDKSNREVDFTDTFFVPQEYYDGLKEERKAKDGDLLYTVTGSYGIPVIVNKLGPFCFQRHIALLRPIREKLHPAFLCYWALSDAVKHLADLVATGIAQKTVGLSSIRRFLIALPPLDLQNEFAQKTESIEKQKELVKKSIMETETLFNSRMDYWFN